MFIGRGKKERKVVVLGLKSKACVYQRRKGLMAADVEEREKGMGRSNDMDS